MTRYAAVVVLVGAATVLRALFDPLLDSGVPFVFHFIAIALSAWTAGLSGGILATLASTVTVGFFFIGPRLTLRALTSAELAGMAVFTASGCGLAWLGSRWRASERRLAESRDLAERAAAELTTKERTLTALMDAVAESIVLFDRDLVLAANTTAAARFDTTPEALRGTPWRRQLPPELAAARAVRQDEVYRTGQPLRFEDDRAGRHFEHTFYPVFGDGGAVTAVAAFSRDVTDRTRLEDALRARAEELVRANRLKDEFLATLSHELRTPLHAILGWADLLAVHPDTPPSLLLGLSTISRNARIQAHIVDDLLDVSRIVTGSFRLAVTTVDVHDAAAQALDAVRPAAAAKHLELRAQVPPGLVVPADAVRLQQVVWNLLANAVKFTPPGGEVVIAAQATADEVDITVRDTGAGIPPDFLPRIFERFSQADSSLTRAHGGLGLGLAIVRHIVELHGGTVTAESAGEGRGATFVVRLPRPASGGTGLRLDGRDSGAP